MTNGGRILAMILMALGVALVSVITGSVAEWFLSRPSARLVLAEDDRERTVLEAIAEIEQVNEEHEIVYQQTIQELKTRLGELERRL